MCMAQKILGTKILKKILLDMQLPKKSGNTVYYDLIKIDSNVKVLLTSGFKSDVLKFLYI